MKNKVFVLWFVAVTLVLGFYIVVVKDKPESSVLENRSLAQLTPLTRSSWFDGTFQSSMESTLADHFVGRDFWVKQYQTMEISLNRLGQGVKNQVSLWLKPADSTAPTTRPTEGTTSESSDETEPATTDPTQPEETTVPTETLSPDDPNYFDPNVYQENYVEDVFDDGYDDTQNQVQVSVLNSQVNLVTLNGEERLVRSQRVLDAGAQAKIQNNIYEINYLVNDLPSDIYVYIPFAAQDSALIYPDANSQTVLPMFDKLTVPYSYLKLDKAADIQRYFFRTDHHWNHVGAYRGYRDIIRLVLGDDEKIFKPVDLVTLENVEFFGSSSRMIAHSYNLPADRISKMIFNLPPYEFSISGEVMGEYGDLSDYSQGDTNYEKGFDHYNNLYLSRQPEIKFDTNRDQLENILVISDSMSNPIRDLIAGHFNESYFINPEQYGDAFDEFDIVAFTEEHQISKTLFFLSLDSYLPGGDLHYIDTFG